MGHFIASLPALPFFPVEPRVLYSWSFSEATVTTSGDRRSAPGRTDGWCLVLASEIYMGSVHLSIRMSETGTSVKDALSSVEGLNCPGKGPVRGRSFGGWLVETRMNQILCWQRLGTGPGGSWLCPAFNSVVGGLWQGRVWGLGEGAVYLAQKCCTIFTTGGAIQVSSGWISALGMEEMLLCQ